MARGGRVTGKTKAPQAAGGADVGHANNADEPMRKKSKVSKSESSSGGKKIVKVTIEHCTS